MKLGDKVKFKYVKPNINPCPLLKDHHIYTGVYLGNGQVMYKNYTIYMGDENLEVKERKVIKKETKKIKSTPKPKRIANLKKQCDKAWGDAVRRRDGNKCQMCGRVAKGLNAHHWIHTKAQGNQTRWDVSNGLTLCYTCHLFKAHSGSVVDSEQTRLAGIRAVGKAEYDRLVNIEKSDVKMTEEDLMELKKRLDNSF